MTRHESVKRAEALSILEARLSSDPLHSFRLHQKQDDFVHYVLNHPGKEAWFIAANRSGKSDAGAYLGAHLARFGFPGIEKPTSGWVSALDFPTSRDVIQPKYFNNGFVPPGQPHAPFIPDHEIAEWRKEDQILKLKNGSIIGFKSAETGRSKYQGAEKDWIHFDEEHPRELYEESVIRVGASPLTFFCTATLLPPEGLKSVTASWVFPLVIIPWQQGRLPNVRLFGASIYDNPGIPRAEIERLEGIYPEGSIQRRIRLNGEWLPGLAGARAYSAFDRLLHGSRSPPDLISRRPLLWTWDFNVEPMCSLVLQSHQGVYWVHRELTLEPGSIPEMCQLFYEQFIDHQGEVWLYGDATSNRRNSQTGKTDYFIILNEMKQYSMPIRMKVPEKNPPIPDRINAVNRLLIGDRGDVRLRVNPECHDLVADLEGVLRDQKGGILKVSNRRDPYFRRTHWSDALGYLVAYEEPVKLISEERRGRSAPIPRPQYHNA